LLPEKKDERGEGASGEQSTSLMTMDHHGNDNNNNKKKNPPQPPPPVTEIRVGPVVKGDRPQRVPSNCSIF
jgi:hypothetical protein